MPEQQGGYDDLRIDSWSLEPADPEAVAGFADAPAEPGLPIRIVVRGGGFRMRARPLRLRVGEVEVRRVSISRDESSLVGYLERMPAEGARVSVEYGPESRAEASEPFTLARLGQGPADPVT